MCSSTSTRTFWCNKENVYSYEVTRARMGLAALESRGTFDLSCPKDQIVHHN